MSYTVKQVAELAGVSVRTLHHYDHIGLLKPAHVTDAGYRIYSSSDLGRLRHILFFRELGFELKQIQEILDSPDFDEHRALEAHRELLVSRQERLAQLIQTIDESLEPLERNESMSNENMFQGFNSERVEEQIAKYRDEAIDNWGKETVEDSEARVRSLSPHEQAQIEAETVDINQNMASLMDSHQPDSPEVQVETERWFNLLNRHFSSYSAEAFAGLGEMYVADERFTAHYESIRPGLAVFFRDSMKVFGDRNPSHS
jgi:MerR family transcriptional regulator, multidrug-efflux activator